MNGCFAQSSSAIHRHTCFLFRSEEEGIGAFQGEILRHERL